MDQHKVVSKAEWLAAREAHLADEKAFDRQRDELSRARRALPWVKLDKTYVFQGADGPVSLAGLFGPRGQLIVYHFMYHPDWEEGCKSCSFWADNYDGVTAHLGARDVAMAVVSRAPLENLLAFRERMGWTFNWVSSFGNDFNYDFHVSFTDEEMAQGEMQYNFRTTNFPAPEAPGISVFLKDDDDAIYHTYSTFARGLDKVNGAYHLLDITPMGRNEDALPFPQAWLRLRDEYGA